MRIIMSSIILIILLFVGNAFADEYEEQQSGKPLVFPKEMVKEHPSDLHMGSDPYYEQEKHLHENAGSDEEGYRKDYDPDMQYYERDVKIKKVK